MGWARASRIISIGPERSEVADPVTDGVGTNAVSSAPKPAPAKPKPSPAFNVAMLHGADAALSVTGEPGKSLTLTMGDTLPQALSGTAAIYHPATGALSTDGAANREWVHRLVDAWLDGHGPEGVWTPNES